MTNNREDFSAAQNAGQDFALHTHTHNPVRQPSVSQSPSKARTETDARRWLLRPKLLYLIIHQVILGLYWGYIGVILGLYWGYIGVILPLILGSVGFSGGM